MELDEVFEPLNQSSPVTFSCPDCGAPLESSEAPCPDCEDEEFSIDVVESGDAVNLGSGSGNYDRLHDALCDLEYQQRSVEEVAEVFLDLERRATVAHQHLNLGLRRNAFKDEEIRKQITLLHGFEVNLAQGANQLVVAIRSGNTPVARFLLSHIHTAMSEIGQILPELEHQQDALRARRRGGAST